MAKNFSILLTRFAANYVDFYLKEGDFVNAILLMSRTYNFFEKAVEIQVKIYYIFQANSKRMITNKLFIDTMYCSILTYTGNV